MASLISFRLASLAFYGIWSENSRCILLIKKKVGPYQISTHTTIKELWWMVLVPTLSTAVLPTFIPDWDGVYDGWYGAGGMVWYPFSCSLRESLVEYVTPSRRRNVNQE